jgi:subtilisin family serine protease
MDFDALEGIEAAIEADVHIINFSHGLRRLPGHPPWIWSKTLSVFEEAFVEAERRGLLCVVAAGNEANPLGRALPGSITCPGGLECVLTVGALDGGSNVLEMSGRGPYYRSAKLRPGQVVRYDHELHHREAITIAKPDVVVLGDQVTSLRSRHSRRSRRSDDPRDFGDPRLVAMSGTSQATAAVSGLAACLVSLAIEHHIDLGPVPGRTLHRLIRCAARPLSRGTARDFGEGTLKWPILQSTLSDFATDPQFREMILSGPGLRLLDS